MSAINKPLSQTVAPRKTRLVAAFILALGVLLALAAATYGYLQQARVENVLIALREVPFGQQITAEDLGTIEVSRHRPVQLAGISNPSAIIGQYAARQIGPNDIIQPNMLSLTPPDEPVYPNGEKLQRNMVQLPFALTTIGPLTSHDYVNLGFNDQTGDPELCKSAGGTALTPTVDTSNPSTDLVASTMNRPYACRLLSRVEVLYVDDAAQVAYLEVTPYQAHVVWSLFASNLFLWGERYGSTSDPLHYGRLDVGQVNPEWLTLPATDTLQLIPGSSLIPGSASR